MADTQRSIADLLVLLADNTSGQISPQDLRDMLVSVHGVYGAILVFEAAISQTGIGTTPVKLTAFDTNGNASGTGAYDVDAAIAAGHIHDHIRE